MAKALKKSAGKRSGIKTTMPALDKKAPKAANKTEQTPRAKKIVEVDVSKENAQPSTTQDVGPESNTDIVNKDSRNDVVFED